MATRTNAGSDWGLPPTGAKRPLSEKAGAFLLVVLLALIVFFSILSATPAGSIVTTVGH